MSKKLAVWDRLKSKGRYLIFDDNYSEKAKDAIAKSIDRQDPETILEDAGIPYTVAPMEPYGDDAFICNEISMQESMRNLDELMKKAFGKSSLW